MEVDWSKANLIILPNFHIYVEWLLGTTKACCIGNVLAQNYTILRAFDRLLMLYSQHDFEPGPLGRSGSLLAVGES